MSMNINNVNDAKNNDCNIIEMLAKYISNPENYNIIIRIFHPTMVQRSYGNEKRFFIPSPYLSIGGIGFKTLSDEIYQQGGVGWICQISVEDRVIASKLDMNSIIPWNFNQFIGNGLHVNGIASGKYFHVNAELVVKDDKMNNYYNFGTLKSEPVHVVSKPPKRQLSKCADNGFVCLKSGMKIAIFQKGKPQIPVVKYMHVIGDQIICSTNEWSCFNIYLVSSNESDTNSGFETEYNIIKYGNRVRLVECLTGISLPSFIIRKVDNGKIITDLNEPENALQLNKIALEIQPNIYFSIFDNQLIQRPVDNIFDAKVPDNIVWTTVETNFIEYKFSLLKGISAIIAPIPIINDVEMLGSSDALAYIIFHGKNFDDRCRIYFGLVPSEIISITKKSIQVKIPSLSSVLTALQSNQMINRYTVESKIIVPISVVRNDGLVVMSDVIFLYNCSSAGGIGEIHYRDVYEQQQAEFEKRVTEDDDDQSISRSYF